MTLGNYCIQLFIIHLTGRQVCALFSKLSDLKIKLHKNSAIEDKTFSLL